jgi:signal peptidase II
VRGGPGSSVRRLAHYLGLLGAVVLLDQATKALIVRFLEVHDYRPIIDGLLSLSHVHNRGAAFGVLSEARLPRIALALVLGGAVGNLIDRVRLGYVVDFVHVYWREHVWPDFNVADSAITVGVILLILDILREPRARKSPAPGIDTAASSPGRID